MPTALEEKNAQVSHLLKQVLDEQVGPIRTDNEALKASGQETKDQVNRLIKAVEDLEAEHKALQLAVNRPNPGFFDLKSEEAKLKFERKSAMNKTLRTGGIGKLTADERKHIVLDMEANIQSGMSVSHGQSDEYKVMYGSVAELGGFLATPEVVADIIKLYVPLSPIRGEVDVRQTAKPWVSMRKRTQTASAVRIAEQATRTETQNVKFGMVQVFPYESFALSVISRQDMDDSELDLSAFISAEFAQQFAVLVGKEIINGGGSGAGECHGFLNNPDIIANAALNVGSVANGYTYADLVKFIYALLPPYRANARFVGAKETLGFIRALTDSTGQPLWMSLMFPQAGQNAGYTTLMGYPFVEAPDMPALADDSLSLAFGDFKQGYQFVERVQISIQVLQEFYANLSAVGFMGYYRFGGDVKLSEAIRVLTAGT